MVAVASAEEETAAKGLWQKEPMDKGSVNNADIVGVSKALAAPRSATAQQTGSLTSSFHHDRSA